MIDDDDDDALPGYFLPHQWYPDGVLPDGKERVRCSRCAVLRHWPAAHATCVRTQITPPALDETQPLHAGQWEGPYAAEQPRTCKACQRLFRRPRRWPRLQTCCRVCSVENVRAANTAQQRRQRS